MWRNIVKRFTSLIFDFGTLKGGLIANTTLDATIRYFRNSVAHTEKITTSMNIVTVKKSNDPKICFRFKISDL